MDLFGDLPDPSAKDKDLNNTADPLFGDLPSEGKDKDSPDDTISDNKATIIGTKRKSTDHADNNHENIPAKQIRFQDTIRLQGFYAERKGERDDMQDAHVIIDDFHEMVKNIDSSIKRLAFYAVYDGHGGARASRFAAQHLHTNLAAWFPKGDISVVEKEIKKCFIEAFKKTDETFLKEATKQKPSWKDGSTAVCVLAINDTLYIANLGDSKAVLCRYNESQKKYTSLPLSKDHSPTQYEERMRIQKAGGHVREGRVMGILEVSRSIGDGPYKSHGVSCIPDVKRCQLTDKDRFLLIACDGLWKRFDSQATVDFVNKILEDDGIKATEFRSECEMRYDTACNRLASEAVRRLSADNVTVLLVAVGDERQPKT